MCMPLITAPMPYLRRLEYAEQQAECMLIIPYHTLSGARDISKHVYAYTQALSPWELKCVYGGAHLLFRLGPQSTVTCQLKLAFLGLLNRIELGRGYTTAANHHWSEWVAIPIRMYYRYAMRTYHHSTCTKRIDSAYESSGDVYA